MTLKAKSRRPGNIAALTFQVATSAGPEAQLLPAGEFAAIDGRPMPWGTWKLSEANAPAVVAFANQRVNEFVIDYEHQTQLADQNGQPAPAAGWFKTVEFRPGKGLWATDVRWTTRATQFIKDEEYKYISAVFLFDEKTGAVLKLMCAALTNNPGLHGMDAIQLAALTAHFSMADTDPAFNSVANPSENLMNPLLIALLKALGLPATDATTQEQAVGAVAALKASASAAPLPANLVKALGLAENATEADATTAVASLKAGGSPDPTKWVSLDTFTQLHGEVAALKAGSLNREVDELLNEARAQGKCSAVVEEVWRAVGKRDIAQLKALIEKTPGNPVLAGQSQTAGRQILAADPTAALTVYQLAMCKNMGLTIEQFRSGAVAIL